MKYFILLLAGAAVFACNKEQVLLDRLSGDYTLTQIDLRQMVEPFRDTTIIPTDYTVSFSDCDRDDNAAGGQCTATLTKPDGQVLFLHYRLTDYRSNEDQLSFMEADGNTVSKEQTNDYRMLLGGYTYQLSGDALTLTTIGDIGPRPTFDGMDYETVRISALRQ
ncbi:hypothetical protein LEM8419_00788 [Neolewinella maritima]|uniref:Lipocalin-like domain-containing protein n=1 Tax=Neolewinella maritima TaxID=1383882 RepID=A0ABN8F0R8_9BACT|nr:hypothetical protein [Neolewinella maritima]CAH0999488.1 hypothetical protein LEM8419_00788 [Neolewinella maritima]